MERTFYDCDLWFTMICYERYGSWSGRKPWLSRPISYFPSETWEYSSGGKWFRGYGLYGDTVDGMRVPVASIAGPSPTTPSYAWRVPPSTSDSPRVSETRSPDTLQDVGTDPLPETHHRTSFSQKGKVGRVKVTDPGDIVFCLSGFFSYG